MRQNLNDVTNPGADVKEDAMVKPGKYRFVIKDGYGDGICCNEGFGKIRIFADGSRIAGSDGKFGKDLAMDLDVGSKTLENKQLSTDDEVDCEDHETTSFYVSDSIGEKDCEWLRENLEYFEYLCDFVNVAQACPSTCDDCQIFK